MPKIKYQDIDLSPEKLRTIQEANRIIESYQAKGYDLTVRQIYYRFVALDLFPEDRTWVQLPNKKWVRDPNGTKNAEPNYTWLGDVLGEGRMTGRIDWNAIVDRTRTLRTLAHWDSPADIVRSAAYSFRIDQWKDQPYRPEVWVEKDALVGIFERVCQELDVPLLSCRGYTSMSEMWGASQRLLSYKRQNQAPYIFHFGDHDPSGKDMSRDIQDRLYVFTRHELEFDRLALNMNQIESYKPPPNPAKVTDPRAKAYIQEFGEESWELDSMEPEVLTGLVRTAITNIQDHLLWRKSQGAQAEQKQVLQKISDNYENVAQYVQEDL